MGRPKLELLASTGVKNEYSSLYFYNKNSAM